MSIGIGIVLVMLWVLAAFLVSSFLKARLYHKQSWWRSILIALESPTCFLNVSKMSMVYAWEKPKSEWGELPDIWAKISMMLWIIGDWFKLIPLLHSVTIGAMVELTHDKSVHTIEELLHKNGLYILPKND